MNKAKAPSSKGVVIACLIWIIGMALLPGITAALTLLAGAVAFGWLVTIVTSKLLNIFFNGGWKYITFPGLGGDLSATTQQYSVDAGFCVAFLLFVSETEPHFSQHYNVVLKLFPPKGWVFSQRQIMVLLVLVITLGVLRWSVWM